MRNQVRLGHVDASCESNAGSLHVVDHVVIGGHRLVDGTDADTNVVAFGDGAVRDAGLRRGGGLQRHLAAHLVRLQLVHIVFVPPLCSVPQALPVLRDSRYSNGSEVHALVVRVAALAAVTDGDGVKRHAPDVFGAQLVNGDRWLHLYVHAEVHVRVGSAGLAAVGGQPSGVVELFGHEGQRVASARGAVDEGARLPAHGRTRSVLALDENVICWCSQADVCRNQALELVHVRRRKPVVAVASVLQASRQGQGHTSLGDLLHGRDHVILCRPVVDGGGRDHDLVALLELANGFGPEGKLSGTGLHRLLQLGEEGLPLAEEGHFSTHEDELRATALSSQCGGHPMAREPDRRPVLEGLLLGADEQLAPERMHNDVTGEK
mmetsp:Transcript_19799/g.45082  ORF Transcript_19799/g.45082 Transcript_19799/m.45082 type:complete len:378 (+) Transcript_19799:3352-4485(+)